VNEVQRWAQKHDHCMLYGVLAMVPRLMEFVYGQAGHVAVRLIEEFLGDLVNLGPLVANTRGATPRKEQA
jgi:hypothetical protein